MSCESVPGAVPNIATVIETLGRGLVDDPCIYGGGVYELSGKFGTVAINAGRPVLRTSGRQAGMELQ